MKTGYRGTFVISWTQTEVDGLENAPVSALGVGSSWRWSGEALRVDGPPDVVELALAPAEVDLRRHAARMVHRLVGAALAPGRAPGPADAEDAALNVGFEVTDGYASHMVTLVDVGPNRPPLLMFTDGPPPAGADLWVVRASMRPGHVNRLVDQPTGVICFTPGTLIRCEGGDRPVEDLAEGDRILTRDNGAQEICWIGGRRISGARMYALPELRPVRLRAGALGEDEPERDLIVSPRHRLLVRGPRAQALFNTDEVLVAAEDLIDDRRVLRDTRLREVHYIHLLLEHHEVVWANGVATESFHPAQAGLENVEPDQRARLIERFPELEFDPGAYGGYARRMLNSAEAAILLGSAA